MLYKHMCMNLGLVCPLYSRQIPFVLGCVLWTSMERYCFTRSRGWHCRLSACVDGIAGTHHAADRCLGMSGRWREQWPLLTSAAASGSETYAIGYSVAVAVAQGPRGRSTSSKQLMVSALSERPGCGLLDMKFRPNNTF